MKIYILLFALTRVTLAQLVPRAPTPGVVSLRYTQRPGQLHKRDGTVDLAIGAKSLTNIVNITVGTPPQPITLTLDTGSSDTIVLTKESDFCIKNAGACPSEGYYNANHSSTYKYITSNFSSNFGFAETGSGSGADGDIATDAFTIAGAKLKDQQFAIIYDNSTLALSILGLSYASGENQVHTKPPQEPYDNFPLSLAKQGATNLALFSLWSDELESKDGHILFGGIDTAKYSGDLLTLDTQKRAEAGEIIAFDVLINGLGISGNSSFPKASTGEASAVLDCGTSDTILPDDWVQPIYDQFDVKYFSANDTAYVDCAVRDKDYTLDFTFDSLTMKVPIMTFVSLRAVNPKVCTFDLVPAGKRHPLLGDNFLWSTFAVFDLTNDQISLAPRDFSSTKDDIVAVPAGGVKDLKSSSSTGPSPTSANPSSTSTDATKTGSDATSSPSETKDSGASIMSIPIRLLSIPLLSWMILSLF